MWVSPKKIQSQNKIDYSIKIAASAIPNAPLNDFTFVAAFATATEASGELESSVRGETFPLDFWGAGVALGEPIPLYVSAVGEGLVAPVPADLETSDISPPLWGVYV